MSSQLYFFVEGDCDERFVRFIIQPEISNLIDQLNVIRYATMKPQKVCAFVRSIRSMRQATAFLTDLDRHPCVTQRKAKFVQEYKCVPSDAICVVSKEIECWYLAGITQQAAKKLRIRLPRDYESFTKEQFLKLIPRSYSSQIDFLQEIIKVYSLQQAKVRCKSLAYTMMKLQNLLCDN